MLLPGYVKIISVKTLLLGSSSFPVRLSRKKKVISMIYANRGSGLIYFCYTQSRVCVSFMLWSDGSLSLKLFANKCPKAGKRMG